MLKELEGLDIDAWIDEFRLIQGLPLERVKYDLVSEEDLKVKPRKLIKVDKKKYNLLTTIKKKSQIFFFHQKTKSYLRIKKFAKICKFFSSVNKGSFFYKLGDLNKIILPEPVLKPNMIN